MFIAFKEKLDQWPNQATRAWIGAHHLEVVKETCIQVKKIVSCQKQYQILDQVEMLMCFGRSCCCEADGPVPLPSDDALKPRKDGPTILCQPRESVRDKISKYTAQRLTVFFGDVEAAMSVIDTGLLGDNGLFRCHPEIRSLLQQCSVILQDHRDILCGVMSGKSFGGTMSLDEAFVA